MHAGWIGEIPVGREAKLSENGNVINANGRRRGKISGTGRQESSAGYRQRQQDQRRQQAISFSVERARDDGKAINTVVG